MITQGSPEAHKCYICGAVTVDGVCPYKAQSRAMDNVYHAMDLDEAGLTLPEWAEAVLAHYSFDDAQHDAYLEVQMIKRREATLRRHQEELYL